MKVKALIDCVGIGYDLKAGDTKRIKKDVALKLIKCGFVEEVKERKSKETKVKK